MKLQHTLVISSALCVCMQGCAIELPKTYYKAYTRTRKLYSSIILRVLGSLQFDCSCCLVSLSQYERVAIPQWRFLRITVLLLKPKGLRQRLGRINLIEILLRSTRKWAPNIKKLSQLLITIAGVTAWLDFVQLPSASATKKKHSMLLNRWYRAVNLSPRRRTRIITGVTLKASVV